MSRTAIRVVTEADEFQAMAPIWNSLLENCPGQSSIYLTHEWLATWWKYFGKKRRLNLLLFEKEGRVIAIVPLARNEYRIGPFKLDALESITWTSCNYVGLILPQHLDEVMAVLLDYLKENLHGVNLILRLSLITEESQFLRALRSNAAQAEGLVFKEIVRTVAPYLELPSTCKEYLGSLRKNRRKLINSTINELKKNNRVVELRQCSADSLEDDLRQLFELHQERWQSVGLRGHFADTEYWEFQREVARKFLNRGWLNLSTLTIDGDAASVKFGCIYDHKFYAMISGRNIHYLKKNVGHLHIFEAIKYAVSRGLTEYDFMQGNETYKFYWTKTARRYMQVIIIKSGFLPALRLKLLRFFLRCWDVRQYSLREVYTIRRIRRRERKDNEMMGLAGQMDKLK